MTVFSSQYISLHNILKNTLNLPFCRYPDKTLNRADLLAHAVYLSTQLPEKRYAINLCQDRYLFIVSYLAVCLAQKISLLPANQTLKSLQDLSERYPDSFIINDNQLNADVHINYKLLKKTNAKCPHIDINRPLSISFTSGSTGEPKAIIKTWREFQTSAELALQRFNLKNKAIMLLATVPMQHMYGLETSLFWVLFSRLCLHNSRPFYPEDIHRALHCISSDTLLVSTPKHLKYCQQTSHQWQYIHIILSSTAPMDIMLAQRIEHTLQAPLLEIFGSTETLSFASRRPVQTTVWQPYQSISLIKKHNQFILHGGHLFTALTLDDYFTIQANGHFNVIGRSNDLIKIAGKRASLTNLNQQLTAIKGIEDGVFFLNANERLSALVVSQLTKNTIITLLKFSMDAVFLPRTIYTVPSLPRNNMGKLLKPELDKLIQAQQRAD